MRLREERLEVCEDVTIHERLPDERTPRVAVLLEDPVFAIAEQLQRLLALVEKIRQEDLKVFVVRQCGGQSGLVLREDLLQVLVHVGQNVEDIWR